MINEKRPLRIASFTYSTKPRGGVVHTLALAEHLQKLGHHVHIFALGKDQHGFFRPTPVSHSLIPFEVMPYKEPLDEKIERYIGTYYQFLIDNPMAPFDIYHVQDCVSANAVWRFREAGYIESFVRTIHHVDDFVSPRLIQCQNDSLYHPDHRIVVSQSWQQQLKAEFKLDSRIIHNGVDLDRFCPGTAVQRKKAREALNLTDDQIVFLNIGGIEPRKNSNRLMKAFIKVRAQLAKAGKTAVLLLAGGETLFDYTPYRTQFFADLASCELEENRDIFVLGTIEDEQIPALYHAADVLAFPSVKEGWGLVALEAMASGVPVLTSDLPVFHEYMQSGTNGLLVDPLSIPTIADGLLELAQDAPLRQRVIENGKQTAVNYSWHKTAVAHESLYYETIKHRSKIA